MVRLYSVPRDALDDDNDSESEESSEESSEDEDDNSEPENKGQPASNTLTSHSCKVTVFIVIFLYSAG